MILLQTIADQISEVTGRTFKPARTRAQGGGCINQAMVIEDGERRYFIKLNQASLLSMFEAEAASLSELAGSRCIRVPEPVCSGVQEGQAYLVLEYLALDGSPDPVRMGQQLAALHHVTAGHFGWHRANTIGSTHQPNDPDHDWIAFWRHQRLGYQLRLAADKGYGGELQKLGGRLLQDFPALFDSYQPSPSLLHGDLWSGNVAGLADATPVIFDPALYYGDREADIAMTELFGGFSNRFYAAYNDAWPLDPGYKTRRTFYNLYHILNHMNLFGGGYHGQSIDMMKRLLSQL